MSNETQTCVIWFADREWVLRDGTNLQNTKNPHLIIIFKEQGERSVSLQRLS